MNWKAVILAVACGMSAASAAAQEALSCDEPQVGPGARAPADVVHQPPAYPGAFGGEVRCVLALVGDTVEQFWLEILPANGGARERLRYETGSLSYELSFEAEEKGPQEVATCTRGDAGDLLCRVDLAAGKGLHLQRAFDADLAPAGVRIVALPARGVISAALWESAAEAVTAGRAELEMELVLPEADWRSPLARDADAPAGEAAWELSGEMSERVMQAIYTERQPVVLEARLIEDGVTTTAELAITADNITYLIDKLAKLEQLMVAGFEGSRDMRF